MNATEELAGLFFIRFSCSIRTGFQKRRFQMQWLEEFKWLAYSEFMKGRFANGVLRAFAPDVVSYKALGVLVHSAQKI